MRGSWLAVIGVWLVWASCALPDDFIKVETTPGLGGGGDATGGSGGNPTAVGGSGAMFCPPFVGSAPDECEEGLAFDTDNCCVMGRSCGYEPDDTPVNCTNGMCAAYEIISPMGIVANNQNFGLTTYGDDAIAWTTGLTGLVRTAPKGGGTIETLDMSATRETTFITTDGLSLYYTDRVGSAVYRVDSLAQPEQVAQIDIPAAALGFGRIFYHAGDNGLYFALDDGNGGIWRANADALGADAVERAPIPTPNGVVVDDTHIYFTERENGRILRVALADAGPFAVPEVLEDVENLPAHMAQDEDAIYWVTEDEVRRRAKRGGSATTLAAQTGEVGGRAIVVDDVYVYWAWYDVPNILGDVYRARKDGSSMPESMLGTPVPDEPVSLAQDCTTLFIAWAGGSIFRVTK